jgi:hypothetical protein
MRMNIEQLRRHHKHAPEKARTQGGCMEGEILSTFRPTFPTADFLVSCNDDVTVYSYPQLLYSGHVKQKNVDNNLFLQVKCCYNML